MDPVTRKEYSGTRTSHVTHAAILEHRKKLPIYEFRPQFIHAVESNQVTFEEITGSAVLDRNQIFLITIKNCVPHFRICLEEGDGVNFGQTREMSDISVVQIKARSPKDVLHLD